MSPGWILPVFSRSLGRQAKNAPREHMRTLQEGGFGHLDGFRQAIQTAG